LGKSGQGAADRRQHRQAARAIIVGLIVWIVVGSYCRFSEKLSEYPVWITLSGLPGPERASKRQTDAPTMTLNASQIRTRVILGHRLPKSNR
jgi:hypothetical protein